MKHDGGWRQTASKYLFQSKWFNLRQDQVDLPSGEPITYTLIEHPGFAVVVPILDDGRVMLEQVYRYTVQETVLECPSGGLDGEPPDVAARRELIEETGWSAGEMRSLGSFFGSTGISDEHYEIFLATNLRESGQPSREPTEQIELEFMPLEDAVTLALSGRIPDSPSALALILAHNAIRDPSSR